MAAENHIIVLLVGNKSTYRASKDLQVKLQALGIGTNNIQITDNSGVLDVAARVSVQDGQQAGEIATKGQLDTVESGIQSQLDGNDTDIADLQSKDTSLQTQINSNDTDIANAVTRLDGHDSDIATAVSRLDGHDTDIATAVSRLDGHDTDISNLQSADTNLQNQIDSNDTDIATAVSRLDGHDTDISNLQAKDATHDSQISDLQSQDATHDSQISDLQAKDVTHDNQITNLQNQDGTHTNDIAALNNDLQAIQDNNPEEEIFTAGVGGQTIFTLTQFTVDADNTVYDLEVYVDGRRQTLDPAGGLTRGFRKNSTTEIELSELAAEGKEVVIFKQGTSTTSLSTDLSSIQVAPRPQTHGQLYVGTQTNAWKGLYLKDQATADVWELRVVNGVFEVSLVQ